MDWDQSEVLPPELARCFNPGWLWSDEREPLNGYDLSLQADDPVDDAIRRAYVDEMERLRPGYVARVELSQRCQLGVLGKLARFGCDWGSDRCDFEAGLELVERFGYLEQLRADVARLATTLNK